MRDPLDNYFVSDRSFARQFTYDLSRVAARLASVVLFRIRCEGRQHIPQEGGGLVCANHQSLLDPVLVGLATDRRLNYLARETLFRGQFRHLIRWYDAIPIERDGMGIGGLKETLRRLRRGELVLIFPEGTRTRDGSIGPLRPGFCALARRGKVPLIPVAIHGAYDVWPRGQRLPQPAPIRIQFGLPIFPEEITAMRDEQLVERTRLAIVGCHRLAGGAS